MANKADEESGVKDEAEKTDVPNVRPSALAADFVPRGMAAGLAPSDTYHKIENIKGTPIMKGKSGKRTAKEKGGKGDE